MAMWNNLDKGKIQAKLDTMVGVNTELKGDIKFSGLLVVDGTIKGNVAADGESESVLHLNEGGCIEGEVCVPNLRINGKVVGDVYACDRAELVNSACIKGSVYYNLLEMAMGAQINGNLVHQPRDKVRLLEHKNTQHRGARIPAPKREHPQAVAEGGDQ